MCVMVQFWPDFWEWCPIFARRSEVEDNVRFGKLDARALLVSDCPVLAVGRFSAYSVRSTPKCVFCTDLAKLPNYFNTASLSLLELSRYFCSISCDFFLFNLQLVPLRIGWLDLGTYYLVHTLLSNLRTGEGHLTERRSDCISFMGFDNVSNVLSNRYW